MFILHNFILLSAENKKLKRKLMRLRKICIDQSAPALFKFKKFQSSGVNRFGLRVFRIKESKWTPTRWRDVHMGMNPKWRESSASRAQSYRWNTLTDDALIEQSSSKSSSYRDRFWSGTRCERRHESRREVVWTLWKMAAAPYQAQWPLRQIVYFARGGGVSGIDAPRRIFGAVRTRLYGLCVIHVARVT